MNTQWEVFQKCFLDLLKYKNMEENKLENTIKNQYDLSTLASMSEEEFSKYLKEMPYSLDRIGQGLVIGSSLPKSETKPSKDAKK